MRTHISGLLLLLMFHFSVAGTGKITITEILLDITMDTPPLHMAPGIDDSLWIVMQDEPIIRLLNGAGVVVRSFGGFGTGYCEFRDRIDLVDSYSLFIYAADTDNNRILKLNRLGVCVREIRNQGDETFETWRPSSVSISESGRIYVADSDAGTVHYIDTFDGLRTFIDPSDRGMSIPLQPILMACDGETLYVVDGSDGAVYSFDALGTRLGKKRTNFEICSFDVTLHGYCVIADRISDDVYLGHWNDDTWVSLRDLIPKLGKFIPSYVCFMNDTNTPQQERYLIVIDSALRRIVKLRVHFS